MKILVTGALGALGKVVMQGLRQAGHDVVGIDRHAADGIIVCSDLADNSAAHLAITEATNSLGGLDAFVHLVGGFEWRPIERTDVALLRSLFSVNVETLLVAAKTVIPLLSEGGALVTVGAASAQPAGEGMGAYAVAKSGVVRITEALAHELAPRRIRVNAILPAVIDTPRNRVDMPDVDPAGWTSPDAVADVIAFLISRAARAINGAAIPVTNPG